MTPQPSAKEEWKNHWPMVAAAMVGMSFYSVVTYTLGVFMAPLEEAFGWSRAQISGGLTAFFLITMVGSPLVGAVIDRFGTRWIATIGMAFAACSLAAFSTANGSTAQWFGLWFIFALCSLTVKSTIWSTSVSSVFTVSRGMALAIALSGTAIGQAASPLLATWLIGEYGWQLAYFWLGLGWGGFAFVLLLFFFYDVRDVNKRQASKTVSAAPVQTMSLPGLTLKEGLRDSRILRIALANTLLPLASSGVTVHMVPILTGTGASAIVAAQIAASAGIAGLAGKIVTGWLLDRFQGNLVPFLSTAVGAIGHFLFLNLLESQAALYVGALILGYASGASFQVTTYLVSRYAGMKAFGTIYGIIASLLMGGTAIGPTIAGLLFDAAGSYTLLLMTASPLALVVAFLFVGLGPYPDFGKPSTEPESQSELAPAE